MCAAIAKLAMAILSPRPQAAIRLEGDGMSIAYLNPDVIGADLLGYQRFVFTGIGCAVWVLVISRKEFIEVSAGR